MNISAICFTEAGYELLARLKESIRGEEAKIKLYYKYKRPASDGDGFKYVEESIQNWAGAAFERKDALLFAGACGIAVRSISPFVRDKLSDSPVIVMDDMGRFVIPILSGHYGGANDLAEFIARKMNAIPVITTATDIHGKFAADRLASGNHLKIMNREKIAVVSSKLLNGDSITIMMPERERADMASFEDLTGRYPGQVCLKFLGEMEGADTDEGVPPDIWISPFAWKYKGEPLWLAPQCIVLGIGCRAGTPLENIEKTAGNCLDDTGLQWQPVRAAASIDIKKDEAGLKQLCSKRNIEFVTFCTEELAGVSGSFTESEFVKAHTGVGNVCERAALKESGGRIIKKKTVGEGVTVAIAEDDWRIDFDKA